MANTRGFEVVVEVTSEVLQQILEAAWDSSLIPHSVDVAPGLSFGPYQVDDGVVRFPRGGLSLALAPADNAIRITFASEIQVEIANPPIPSARMFDMTADISVAAPVRKIGSTINVGIGLDGLPRANVSATITSGDPIGPLTISAISEYVHERYEDETIPHEQTVTGVSMGGFSADVFVEMFDDPSDATRRIEVSQPTPATVKISIPMHLKLSNVTAATGPSPLSPMGVTARITITADLVTSPGSITATLATAVVDVEDLAPATGIEGSNYNTNKAFYPGDLDAVMEGQIKARGQQIVNAIGDIEVVVPTIAQIETFIGDQAHAALIARGDIPVWTPTAGEVTITDVVPRALADVLAVGINPGSGADASALGNFVPAGRDFAVALDGAKVLALIDETIHRPEEEGGFGPDFPPKTFSNVDGHDARLTSLSISLRDGAIHMEGDVTVIDAIADSIDVDASFEANSGLEWEDNPEGGQRIRPFLIDKDVDLSVLAWIVSFLIGFITLGLVGGIVALVVVFVVEGVAERVGGAVIRDEVTGQVKGVGALPQELQGIGTIDSRFENPIVIESDGLVFSG